MDPQDIAGIINMDIGEAKLAEAFGKPMRPFRFAERGSGNAGDFELPGSKLGFLGAKAGKERAYFGQGREPGDLRRGW